MCKLKKNQTFPHCYGKFVKYIFWLTKLNNTRFCCRKSSKTQRSESSGHEATMTSSEYSITPRTFKCTVSSPNENLEQPPSNHHHHYYHHITLIIIITIIIYLRRLLLNRTTAPFRSQFRPGLKSEHYTR